jgi:hypothetical protein
VVYSQVSYGVFSNRLDSTDPYCPEVVDPNGMWLAWGYGLIAAAPNFTAEWQSYFESAQYVVMTTPYATVIHLDTPWWICASRAFLRGLRKSVGEMPEGCEDSFNRRLRDEWGGVGKIWRNRRSEPQYARSEFLRHGSDLTVHVLRSRREATAFLDALSR